MRDSSKPEAAFVLLMIQSLAWTVAGISAFPFAVAGEVFMIGLGIASLVFALATCLLGIGVLWRRRWARRLVIALEVTCVLGSLLLMALPVGANHGVVSWMTNVGLPVAVILLLRRSAHEVAAFV